MTSRKGFFTLTLILCLALVGCGQAQTETSEQEASLADGSYAIEVTTDSSMFHADSCTLEVEDGTYTAHLSLPGEGFSRLYFGSAEEAAEADDSEIYDYYLNDEDKYTFDVPVAALDEELEIAAYGQRRDTWYPHTIVFCSPAEEAVADAA